MGVGCCCSAFLAICPPVLCNTKWNGQAFKLKSNTALIMWVSAYSALGYGCQIRGHGFVTQISNEAYISSQLQDTKWGATYCLSGYLLLVGQHCWLGLTVGFRQQHGREEDLGCAQQFHPASRMCTWIWNDPGGGFRDACQRVVSSNLESSCWLQACKYTNTGTRRHSQSAYTCLSSCAVGRGVLALGSPNLAAQFG